MKVSEERSLSKPVLVKGAGTLESTSVPYLPDEDRPASVCALMPP